MVFVLEGLLSALQNPVAAGTFTLDSTSQLYEPSYSPGGHAGAYYTGCGDTCADQIVDPDLKPIVYPMSGGEAGNSSSQLYEPSYSPGGHAGAYYTGCGDTCADQIVDPVLQPIVYPSLAPPVAVSCAPRAPPKKGDAESPANPGPGPFMLMAPALLFGAAEATTKLLTKKEESKGSWMSDFQAESCRAADAVTPVGGYLLKRGMEGKA